MKKNNSENPSSGLSRGNFFLLYRRREGGSSCGIFTSFLSKITSTFCEQFLLSFIVYRFEACSKNISTKLVHFSRTQCYLAIQSNLSERVLCHHPRFLPQFYQRTKSQNSLALLSFCNKLTSFEDGARKKAALRFTNALSLKSKALPHSPLFSVSRRTLPKVGPHRGLLYVRLANRIQQENLKFC